MFQNAVPLGKGLISLVLAQAHLISQPASPLNSTHPSEPLQDHVHRKAFPRPNLDPVFHYIRSEHIPHCAQALIRMNTYSSCPVYTVDSMKRPQYVENLYNK